MLCPCSFSGEFLKQCKPFVEEGVHPRVIIKSFRRATQLALEKIKELSVGVAKENKEELRELLVKCAATAMSSKLIHQQKDFFSHMVVDAVQTLDELLPLNMIGIKKVQGGSHIHKVMMQTHQTKKKKVIRIWREWGVPKLLRF